MDLGTRRRGISLYISKASIPRAFFARFHVCKCLVYLFQPVGLGNQLVELEFTFIVETKVFEHIDTGT